jgi:glutathione S-transferase
MHHMTIPRLYHVTVPGFVQSRAFRCIWILEELGVEDYEVCLLNGREPYAPQMTAYGVQRSHKVPTLQVDGREMAESGVICQFLAEAYGNDGALLGTSDERFERMYWISMAETCISFRIPFLPTLMDPTSSLDEIRSRTIEPMKGVYKANIQRFEAHFAEHDREFLLDSGFSIADAMCGWSLFLFNSWGLMDLTVGDSPQTLAYLQRLQARPAFQATEKYADLSPGLYCRGGIPA